MKRYLGLIFAATLAFGTAVMFAQDQSSQDRNKPNKEHGSREQVQDTKTTTDSGTTKTSSDTISGKLEEYQLGKMIKISTPGKTEGTRTIDLTGRNLTANVDSDVKVGDWVSVTERTDNNGHKTITVKKSEASRSKTENPHR